MEREPVLLGLIGVMFSWTLELRLHAASLVLVPVAGRVEPPRLPGTQGDDLFTLSSPSGVPPL